MSKAVGVWKNFEFKQLEPKDHPRVLAHLRECLYYPSMYRLGYQKSMDDENEKMFEKALEKGGGLTLFAEDRTTGVIVGARIVSMENRDEPTDYTIAKNTIARSAAKFYGSMIEDCKIWERYPTYNEIPHMFGLCTHPDFQKQGIATELYRRSKILLQEEGHHVAIVGFISPYSRAAGVKNGFIRLTKRYLTEAVNDETGEMLNPNVDPEEFQDVGVFEF